MTSTGTSGHRSLFEQPDEFVDDMAATVPVRTTGFSELEPHDRPRLARSTTMTTTHAHDTADLAVLDDVRATRDSISVRRVFGDPYTVDDVTIIPVARVAGGGGGGGGEGTGPNDEGGHGFGSGFGLTARPVGIYEIRNGHVTWKPTMDADRLARGGQLIAGLLIACLTIVLARRPRIAARRT